MRIRNYIYMLIAGATFVSSCKKDFLVATPPTGVPVSLAIETDYDMADAVEGMYSTMRQYTSFGRDIPVLGDLLADNVYVSNSNSGRYLPESNLSYTSGNAEASDIWVQGYYTILQANRIINAPTSLSDATANQLRGEAYTARGLEYLELVNWFAASYTVNPTGPGVPIVTGYQGPFTLPARSSVSDVYKRIITDLDSAYILMPTTAISSSYHATSSEYISKYTAKAIEARAYLYKSDYANALAASLVVIQNGGYTLAASTALGTYWANPAPQTGKLETIFELALNTATYNQFNGLDYIYIQAGYGDLLCTDPLYALYSSTDVRKSLIISGTRASFPALIVNKYSSFSNATDKDDIKIIRYAEVLLTAAESYAQTGDNLNAQLYLNQVATKRDPSFTGYTDTGAALIADILTERRKEFAFEGLRYFDLSRTNVVINRPVEPYGYASLTPIAVGDYRRILPIPIAETNANPNIAQNPNY